MSRRRSRRPVARRLLAGVIDTSIMSGVTSALFPRALPGQEVQLPPPVTLVLVGGLQPAIVALTGTTPGRWAMGLRTTSARGRRGPSRGRLVLREALPGLIALGTYGRSWAKWSWLALDAADSLLVVGSSSHRGWRDRITATRVTS